MTRYAHITGWGMAVPEKILTNEEISQMVDTNDAWIVSHSGIKERRVASPEETTASLAADAALEALEQRVGVLRQGCRSQREQGDERTLLHEDGEDTRAPAVFTD